MAAAAAAASVHRLLVSRLQPLAAGLARSRAALGKRERRSSYLLLAPLLAQTKARADLPPPPCVSMHNIQRFQWIGEFVPAFRISGSQVNVLSTPAEFYDTLKEHIMTAKKRIVLASLYLGTGPLEQELVQSTEANHLHVFGMWEKTGASGENSHGRKENAQIKRRQHPWSGSNSGLWRSEAAGAPLCHRSPKKCPVLEHHLSMFFTDVA